MKGIHISDLHFHTDNENNKESLRLIKMTEKDYPNHYIFITGDITDDGHKKQYENAYDALYPIMDKTFICPGNHDYGVAGIFYDSDRHECFYKYFSFRKSQMCENILMIGLDSNLKTVHPWDFACGEIGKEQLQWLDMVLSNSPQAKKIVYLHHHPFMHNHPFMELKDAKELIKILYNRVDLLLFGHKHTLGYWKNICGIKRIHAAGNPPYYWEFEI